MVQNKQATKTLPPNSVKQGNLIKHRLGNASELLNVSNKTVYRLINDGKLASLKVGRASKIPKLHLLQYIKVLEHTQLNS